MEEIETQQKATSYASVIEYINSLNFTEAEDSIKEAERKALYRLTAQLMYKVRETATIAKIAYTEEEIKEYISTILERTIKLQHTTLSDYPHFIDGQHYTQYKDLIRQAVKASGLSKRSFKCKALRYQRTALERSKTLHELRINASLLIEPMKEIKKLEQIAIEARQDEKESFKAYDTVIKELEQLQALADERKRIIDSVLDVYNEPFKIKANKLQEKIELLAKIDKFKAKHNASDEQAGKVFDISRKTIYNMRKDVLALGSVISN